MSNPKHNKKSHHPKREGTTLGDALGVPRHSDPCYAAFGAWKGVKARFDAVKKELNESWEFLQQARSSCDRCQILAVQKKTSTTPQTEAK